MNETKPDTPNTSWDNVPHDIMVPVPIKMHPPVILDHSLPITHGPMPVPQIPLVCIFYYPKIVCRSIMRFVSIVEITIARMFLLWEALLNLNYPPNWFNKDGENFGVSVKIDPIFGIN